MTVFKNTRFMLLIGLCLLGANMSNKAAAGDMAVTVMSNKNVPLGHAIVMVTPTSGQTVSPSQNDAIMAQQDTQFNPFILGVRKGSAVSFPNRDRVRHHVYSFSKAKSFELRLYGKDEDKKVSFDETGLVALGCNIHDNMLAFIYVVDAPLFAKTDAKGIANFTGLPAGSYTVKVWHIDQKSKQPNAQRTVTLSKDIKSDLSFVLDVRKNSMQQGKPGQQSGRY